MPRGLGRQGGRVSRPDDQERRVVSAKLGARRARQITRRGVFMIAASPLAAPGWQFDLYVLPILVVFGLFVWPWLNARFASDEEPEDPCDDDRVFGGPVMIGHPWYSQFDAKLPLDQGPYGSSVGYASAHMIDCLTDGQA